MNYLAHALLAGEDDSLILGSLLGDFVRGPVSNALPSRVADGVRLHRAVDVYTDSHPAICAAKAMFNRPLRRYAAILLDVWFDHVLANDFARWSKAPLTAFSMHINDVLIANAVRLPPALRHFADYMAAYGLPAAYADPVQIERTLRGISARLRYENPIAAAMPELVRRATALREAFEAFFPQLTAHAAQWRRARSLP